MKVGDKALRDAIEGVLKELNKPVSTRVVANRIVRRVKSGT